jgi:hypothetical protein
MRAGHEEKNAEGKIDEGKNQQHHGPGSRGQQNSKGIK